MIKDLVHSQTLNSCKHNKTVTILFRCQHDEHIVHTISTLAVPHGATTWPPMASPKQRAFLAWMQTSQTVHRDAASTSSASCGTVTSALGTVMSRCKNDRAEWVEDPGELHVAGFCMLERYTSCLATRSGVEAQRKPDQPHNATDLWVSMLQIDTMMIGGDDRALAHTSDPTCVTIP